MRKVYVNVITRLILKVDEDIKIYDVLNEMDYNFRDTTGKADIEDTEFVDYEIKDSK